MASAKEYNMLFRLQAQIGKEFGSTFAEAQRTLQQTQSKISELNKQQTNISAYEKQQKAVEATARKLQDLQKEHDNIQREMKESEQYSSSLENKLIEKQRAIDNTTNALQRQTEKLEQQKAALQNAGVDTNHLTDESKRLASEMEDLSKKEKEAAAEVEKYGKQGVDAFEAVGSALVEAGIIAGLKSLYDAYAKCVQIAGDFQSTMSTVEALSGASAEDMAALSAQAKELGATTKFTATEAAEAMTYMGMAGWDAQQMMSGMDGVLQLAAASGEDLALTSDIVTDNLTAFGLKAEDTAHFADVLAAAATNSNTSVSVMGETFKQSASVAGALGYSIEDVSVAVGLMANAGVKGSIAGTAMKNTFNGLLSGATLTSEAFGEIEISAVKADGTMKSFGESVDELRGYFSQMTEAERVNNAMAIAGQRGYNGLLAIVNSTDADFQKLTESIKDCDGAAKEMADTRMDNYVGQVTLMNSAMDALKTTIGEAFQEELTALAKIATEILTGVNQFLSDNPLLLKAILATTAALGGTIAVVQGINTAKKIKTVLSTLSEVITKKETAAEIEETAAEGANTAAKGANAAATQGATAAQGAHTAAMSASALKMGALIAVVAAVTAEFAYYANSIWGVSDAVKDVQKETQGIIDKMDESIASSNAEMAILQSKVDVYNELRNKQNKTADEQARLANLAKELQDTFGDEVEIVNSLTGEYNDLTAAVENYVENQSKRVEYSSMEEAAKEAYAEIDKINREMDERTKKYHEYEDNFSMGRLLDWNGAVGQQSWMNDMKGYRAEIAKNQKIIDEYEAMLREEAGALYETGDAAADATKVNKQLYDALYDVEIGLMSVSEAAANYNVGEDALNNAVSSAKAYKQTLHTAVEMVRNDFKSAEEAAEQYGLTVNAIDTYATIQASIDQIKALADAYDEALEAAEKSIQGQYKLWDDAAAIVAEDIGAINSSLSSQIDYWKEYNDNIEKLTAKAEDIEGLRAVIATFADGSPESANMIAGLAQASDEELKKMVENWQSVQTEQHLTAEGLAELTTGANKNISDQQDAMNTTVDTLDISDEAAQAAKDSIDAYVQGIINGTDGAVAAAERLSSLVAAALQGQSIDFSAAETPTTTDDAMADALSAHYNQLAEVNKSLYGPYGPDFVGPIPPEAFSGMYAEGTDNAAAGLALVGENGPEIVDFSGGEKVYTAGETSAILGGGSGSPVNINIAPSFHVEGGNTENMEAILITFREELIEELMDVLEERNIDAQRRVYK